MDLNYEMKVRVVFGYLAEIDREIDLSPELPCDNMIIGFGVSISDNACLGDKEK